MHTITFPLFEYRPGGELSAWPTLALGAAYWLRSHEPRYIPIPARKPKRSKASKGKGAR